MSDDKKPPLPQPSEDKKYAQVWRQFVRQCGDAVGMDADEMSPDIAELLAEDSNYRLREAIHNAGQFMRHAKRKKLTNIDFNNALRWSDVEPVHGYSSTEPLPFINVKEAEVFCSEDHEINLVLMATRTHAYQNPGISSVTAQWLAIEGVMKNDSPSVTGSIPSERPLTGNKKSGVVVPTVSDNLMSYYNQVTKAILGNNEEVTKVALEDLKTNSRIAPLLPFFINFVCVGVKKVSHDLNQLTKLLYTVRSITDNRYIYLGPKPLLKMLVHGVMYCIVEPLAASLNPINDHWALRDYAARLLAHIVRIWSTPVNQLYESTLETLKNIFRDLTKPFCSHYGAVIALIALGIEPVRTCIYTNMALYWPHLMSALVDLSLSNVPFKSDANKVYGALLMASEFLIIHERRDIVNAEIEDNSPAAPEVAVKTEPPSTASSSSSSAVRSMPKVDKFSIGSAYSELYGYFGDALSMRLPYTPCAAGFHVPPPIRLVRLFTSDELAQTGEELLEAFNVKEEEVQSNSDIQSNSRYSYDENSPMSDDLEPSVEVDLRIKSTVSDPTLGIKLTIAKLPRSVPAPVPEPLPAAEPLQPSTSVASPSAATSESDKSIKKLSIKIPKDQLADPMVVVNVQPEMPSPPFEETVVKRADMYIEFNFDGSMPVPRHQLKRKRIEDHPFNRLRVEQTFKTKNLAKKVHKSIALNTIDYARATRIFRTGNIATIV